MKCAVNSEVAWKMQNKFEDEPHGWIQWKGTDVCLDLTCECGQLTHLDSDFAYFVKCGLCGRVYALNGHIEIIQLKEEPEDVKVTFGSAWEEE